MFGTKLWILESGLLKGVYRKCGFQIHIANIFCRRKGKVGPSFASGFLTKMVICDCSWNTILNEIVDIGLWFAQRFSAGTQVSDPKSWRIWSKKWEGQALICCRIFNAIRDMQLQWQRNFKRNCGYLNMVCSRICIGNAGFSSEMLTDLVEEM